MPKENAGAGPVVATIGNFRRQSACGLDRRATDHIVADDFAMSSAQT
jgi:hypothetical protein